MPRCRDIGFAPAATFFTPSRKIACARTVAVVVPSPAVSLVFTATSRTIWAPMFSYLSFSSISLATVTPSLVIVGLPNFLSMTTLRPFGPSVAFTAAAMMLTPLSSALRASSSNLSCFGIAHVPPLLENGEDVFLAHDEVLLVVLLDLFLLETLDHDSIVQRTNLHLPAPSGLG